MENVINIVDYSQLRNIILYSIKNKKPLFIEGKSGIGKSTIVNDTAKELGIKVIDIRAILYDVGDLVMKVPNKEFTEINEIVSNILPRDGEGIIFFDELKQAPSEVRRLFYQLILDRRLGNYYIIPQGWSVIAASNLDSELEQDILENPLFDRFTMRVRLESDYKLWKVWALNNNLNPIILSHLELNPDEFYMVESDTLLLTPRRWQEVSNALENDCDDNIIHSILPPNISDKFIVFMKKMDLFINYEDYVSGKKDMPEEIESQCALAAIIIKNVKSESDILKILSSKMKLNKEVDIFLRFSSIEKFYYEFGKDKKLSKMAILSKINNKLKDVIIENSKKYGWLVE